MEVRELRAQRPDPQPILRVEQQTVELLQVLADLLCPDEGTSSTDAYAVGYVGTILDYDGTLWIHTGAPELKAGRAEQVARPAGRRAPARAVRPRTAGGDAGW